MPNSIIDFSIQHIVTQKAYTKLVLRSANELKVA